MSSEEADKIQKLLDNIPSEKKGAAEKGTAGKWYLSLTNEQIQECKKDPQLFVVRVLRLFTRLGHALLFLI